MSSRPSRGAARLAAILDALPDALLLVNCNGTVVNANTIALEAFETPGTALVGRGLLDLLPEFDSKRIPGSMRRPDEDEGEARTKPTRMVARRTDGTEFLAEVTSANVADGRATYQSSFDAAWADHGTSGSGGGRGKHFTGDELLMIVLRDLSGTLDTEAELARQQRQTEMILRAASEGVVGVDTEGRVVLVNPSAAQILGYRASDLGGKHLHPLVHHSRPDGSQLPYEETPLSDTLGSGRKHRVRVGQVLWAKDGRPVPVDMTTAPVRDGEQLVGAVLTFTDRRPYESLAERHAQLQAVLGDALRGPLEQLRGDLSGLAADPAGQLWPEANQILHHLAAGYARMTTLVDNVLSYQRLDSGQEKLRVARVALDGVVAAGVEGAVELIGPGRAQFAVHAPPIEAEVDAERLVAALAHLVADVAGVDATGSAPVAANGGGDSTIVVAAAQRGDVVRIEVRGPHPGGSPVHEPIARGIVRQHGGVLQTHEVPGNGGSAYVLEVPVTAGAAVAGRAGGGRGAGGTNGGGGTSGAGTSGGGRHGGGGTDGGGAGGGSAPRLPDGGAGDGGSGAHALPGGNETTVMPVPAQPARGTQEARQAAPGGGAHSASGAHAGAPDGGGSSGAHAGGAHGGDASDGSAGALVPAQAGSPDAGAQQPRPTGRRRGRPSPAEAQAPGGGGRLEPVDPRGQFPGAGPGGAHGPERPGAEQHGREPYGPGQAGPGQPGPGRVGPERSGPYGPGPQGELEQVGAPEQPVAARRPLSGGPRTGDGQPEADAPGAAPQRSAAGRRARRALAPPAGAPDGEADARPVAANGAGTGPHGQSIPQQHGAGGSALPALGPGGGGTPDSRANGAGQPALPSGTPSVGTPPTSTEQPGTQPGPAPDTSGEAPTDPAAEPAAPGGRRARRLAAARARAEEQAAGQPSSNTPFAMPPSAPEPVAHDARPGPGTDAGGVAAPAPGDGSDGRGAPPALPGAQPLPPPSGGPLPLPELEPAPGEPAADPRLADHSVVAGSPILGGGPLPQQPPAAAQPLPMPGAEVEPYGQDQASGISVRTLGQGVPFSRATGEHTGQYQVPAAPSPAPAIPSTPSTPAPPAGSGRRRRLSSPGENGGQPGGQTGQTPVPPQPAAPPQQHPAAAPQQPHQQQHQHQQARQFAIGAPDVGAAEGPEPLDGPNGAVEVTDGTGGGAPDHLRDDELPPEPLDNPRRLLVWPEPDVSTQQALSARGYRPVIVHSREEVDAQIAAYPAALFVDPLTGPITRTALQSLRQAAVAAEVPVLVTAGLGQATREAAYGADPAVLLKALAPRDSEQHPPRVLLVEENAAIAGAFSATLERRGMQVAHAPSDADAVHVATQIRPNLVVMDLMQIRRRRAGIIDWLRDNGLLHRTPFVVYTSSGMDPAGLPRLATGETVLFLAERSTSAEVQSRIVDLLAKIGAN
ncbi:PAS domain-containing protein [Streptomyces sp. Z26]|uniref:response regulator n=1 Tax=Streptomyces sp. Z26 TaxID=2500177 RepID=UPI000EF14485|nr:PAS domain-containing protein [Streptomyces sp. Z26]RLL67936.1 PAS domain-containing protein [Streptomyces sp. Z26]